MTDIAFDCGNYNDDAGAGYRSKSRVLINMAVSLAQALGLHNEARYAAGMPTDERQLRKSLWWITWQCDVETAIQNSVPCVADNSSSTLVSYPDISVQQNAQPLLDRALANSNKDSNSIHSFAAHMNLLQIVHKVFRLLLAESDANAQDPSSTTHTQIGLERCTLALELQLWYASLPSQLATVQQQYFASPHTTTAPALTNSSPSPSQPTWRDAAMLALFHATRIELHLPQIMRLVDIGLHKMAATDAAVHGVVERVGQSAARMTHLGASLQQYLQ
eukprot:jgi/Hompol1/3584/HPOL_006630-RA